MECLQQDAWAEVGQVQNQQQEEHQDGNAVPNASQKVSITQAAKLHNVTRQAIYVAIKQKKLKASKTTRWEIDLQDLEDYRRKRYSRANSTYQGELLFDNEKGFYSVGQVASMLNVPEQKIYYATRIGAMKGERRGSAWVIHISEVDRYRNDYLKKEADRKGKSLAAMQEGLSSLGADPENFIS
ncbi:helix-turn-helix domain-containing protein [Chlamydia sp.]|uniref:helix-turn-helix domain-containing protein n=1 Tax=Chlamydia sp. TaxID=35827 RepID=UPI0025C07CAB|nr:helix-turn-helix domain-containing protein [Chlamydia sp.]MBQ8498654.1 helix-turn-helix domain-containing protein [Chlamydia sp.]